MCKDKTFIAFAFIFGQYLFHIVKVFIVIVVSYKVIKKYEQVVPDSKMVLIGPVSLPEIFYAELLRRNIMIARHDKNLRLLTVILHLQCEKLVIHHGRQADKITHDNQKRRPFSADRVEHPLERRRAALDISRHPERKFIGVDFVPDLCNVGLEVPKPLRPLCQRHPQTRQKHDSNSRNRCNENHLIHNL